MLEQNKLTTNTKGVNYTYNGSEELIILDHIATSNGITVVNNKAIHCVENTSDHDPVYSNIKIPIKKDNDNNISEDSDNSNESIETGFTINWKNTNASTIQKYKDSINIKLMNLNESASEIIACKDINCSNHKHREAIDTLYDNLIKSMEDVAVESFGKVHTKSNNNKKKYKNKKQEK